MQIARIFINEHGEGDLAAEKRNSRTLSSRIGPRLTKHGDRPPTITTAPRPRLIPKKTKTNRKTNAKNQRLHPGPYASNCHHQRCERRIGQRLRAGALSTHVYRADSARRSSPRTAINDGRGASRGVHQRPKTCRDRQPATSVATTVYIAGWAGQEAY